MSLESAKKFVQDVTENKELASKFSKTVDRIAGEKTAQSNGELFAKAAQELGYNITAADFERLDAEREEISADELEQVAGGFDHDTEWCFKDYYCDYAWNRKQDDKGHDDSSPESAISTAVTALCPLPTRITLSCRCRIRPERRRSMVCLS